MSIHKGWLQASYPRGDGGETRFNKSAENTSLERHLTLGKIGLAFNDLGLVGRVECDKSGRQAKTQWTDFFMQEGSGQVVVTVSSVSFPKVVEALQLINASP